MLAIWLYEILHGGKVAYNVFHILQIKWYITDKSHVLQLKKMWIEKSLTYEERHIKILDSKVCNTYNKDIKTVNVF